MRNSPVWRWCACFIGIWGLSVAGGCGTSVYDDLLAKRAAALRGAAPFKVLFGPTELPDTPIRIRVPMMFKHSYLENSAHPDDGARISPDRLQPPFLPLPGLKVCYENIIQTQNGFVPYYCYLAAVPCKPGDAAKLAADIQARLKQKFPEAPDWETIDCNGPSVQPLQWKKIRVTGEQPFRVGDVNTKQVAVQNLAGDFELWIYDAQDYVVLVGWRGPTVAIGPSQTLDSKGNVVATAEPRLDINALPPLTGGTLVIDAAAAAGS